MSRGKWIFEVCLLLIFSACAMVVVYTDGAGGKSRAERFVALNGALVACALSPRRKNT